MSKKKTVLVSSLCATLAACGGGGTGAGGGASSYAAQLASVQGSFDNFTFTPENSLPSGSATYRGVAAFNTTDLDSIPTNTTDPNVLINSIEGYYGALTLNMNFAGNTLTGSVGSFQDFSGAGASGSLSIAGGTITAATNASIGDGYNATASGSIDGEAYTFDVDGNFFDDNGEGVSVYFESTGANEAIGTGMAAR